MSKTLVEVFAAERKVQLAALVSDLPQQDLRTLRAIINGKLSKRTISPEAQARMQAGRKKKEQPRKPSPLLEALDVLLPKE